MNSTQVKERTTQAFPLGGLVQFAAKTFIIVFAVYLVIMALFIPIFNVFDRLDQLLVNVAGQMNRFEKYAEILGSQEGGINGQMKDLKFLLYGLGNNPEAHYLIAEQHLAMGDLEGAKQEMSLAIGLTDPDVKKYKDTYNEINDQMYAPKNR